MKIALISNTDGALYYFRKNLIQKLLKEGHSISSITSNGPYVEKLSAIGVKTRTMDFAKTSASFFQNFIILRQIKRILAEERPDIVHNFTHKPAIYGTIGARLSGIKRIFVTITGLGILFTYNDFKTKVLRALLLLQYKVAMRYSTKIFFQNPDDMEYFTDKKIVKESKAVLTSGSGVDLYEFSMPYEHKMTEQRRMLGRELGSDLGDRIVVLFPARALKEKGFFEFYESARLIKRASDNYVFIHLGLIDADPKSKISRQSIEIRSKECGVFYLGFKDNIKDYMAASDIVVLPSTYREGVPRSLIEALALDKYIITTDTPGCRETVIEGWNGVFCKAGDVDDLATKILSVDMAVLEQCKGRSRKYCEEKFDVEDVIRTTMSCYFAEEGKSGQKQM